MITSTKQQIKNDLSQYVAKVGGQMAASRRLKSISNGTISNIINDKWDNISDLMWQSIENQLKNTGWMHSPTKVSNNLEFVYADAKAYSEVRGIIAGAGRGKTHTAKRFVVQNEESFLISCDDRMTQKEFLEEIINVLGKKPGAMTTRAMLLFIAKELLKMGTPLLIFDEFDKVKDSIIYLFISLYNRTEDKAALVIQGAPYLKSRLKTMAERDKKGGAEVLSRINGRFIEPKENTIEELLEITQINGISDKAKAIEIVNDADFNIRRVKSQTKVALRKANRKEAA